MIYGSSPPILICWLLLTGKKSKGATTFLAIALSDALRGFGFGVVSIT
jgi:hypothetical protein